MRKNLCTVLLGLSLGLTLNAAVNDLPVKKINGKDYYCYRVEAGEGTLAICKKLGLKLSEIEKYNPEISSGLRVDQELLFPVKEFGNQRKVAIQKHIEVYTAKKGDTVYGISKAFGMELYDFLELNPDAIEGVKTGEKYKVTTIAPLSEQKEPVGKARDKEELDTRTDTETHIIASHETLYSIAKASGCSVDDIVRLNPGLDRDKLSIGQKVIVPVNHKSAAEKVSSAFSPGKRHIVKAHETFYGVAGHYGISVEQLQNANPGVNLLKEGMTIIIPDSCAEQNLTETSIVEAAEIPAQETTDTSADNTVATETPKDTKRLTVALMLPFQSSLKEKSREGKSSAEFYRGFMLAADSLKEAGMPMTIIALDTEKSGMSLNDMLSNPAVAEAGAIIAPDNAQAMDSIAAFGVRHKINVFNFFSTKDDTYLTNPYVFQGNIPYDDMVERAAGHLIQNIGDATVVILHPKNAVDKIDVVETFKGKLKASQVPVVEITFNGKLSAEELSKLSSSGNYIFLTTTAKSAPSGEILAALAQYQEENPGTGRWSVFGYPEWIVFKGKPLENMKAVNTSIYSRFYIDPAEEGNKGIADSHVKWYGADIPAGVPRMTISGYDAASFLIKSWKANKGDFSSYSPDYSGEQTTYRFKKTASGGWVNEGMYIISYHPSGWIEKISL